MDDHLDETAALELYRRNVDCDLDVIGPGFRLRAGGSEHPLPQLGYEAGFFRDRLGLRLRAVTGTIEGIRRN